MSKAEIDAARRAAILSGAKLYPKGACHYDGHRLGKGALWCAKDCADQYEKERAELMAPKKLVLGVERGGRSIPLVDLNRLGSVDQGPVQLISTDLLTYYQRLDRAARVFLTQSQIDQIRAGA